MTSYDDLRKKIDELIDPGFNLPFKVVGGIKKLFVGQTGVVELELYQKEKKKNKKAIKIQVIKLVKIELGFPGIKIDFFESEYIPEGEKPIKYLAVASGKGGVGKSSVTANLAAALIRQGKKVGIIDADVYGASIPNILQIDITPLNSTEDEKMIPLNKDGIEVISTEFFMPPDKPLMWRGPMLGKMLIHFFSGVKWQDQIDLILIDLPPGTGDVALDVKTYVPKSKILVVTTPHVNASHVVENMSYYYNTCSKTREFIFGQGGGETVAKKLGVPVMGQIPIGQPQKGNYVFTDKDEAGKIYNDIAKVVIKEMEI